MPVEVHGLELQFNFLQGFNTGVVLYHLENMRSSHLYNEYVNPENGHIATSDLAKKYKYSSHLGDQVSFIRVCSYVDRAKNMDIQIRAFKAADHPFCEMK